MQIKKIILVVLFTLMASFTCNSQEIELAKRKFFDFKGLFTQEGERLTMNQVIKVMDSNPKALAAMKSARTTRFLGHLGGGIGTNLLLSPIKTSINSYNTTTKETNWTLVGIGAGLVALDIGLAISTNKSIKKSLELYNEELDVSSYRKPKPEFEIIGNQNGLGLRIKF